MFRQTTTDGVYKELYAATCKSNGIEINSVFLAFQLAILRQDFLFLK